MRKELDHSFAELVERTRLGAGYISELERGLVMPSAGTLTRVAEALDVTVADLVAGDTERERLFCDLRGAKRTLLRSIRALVDAEAKKRPPTR